jgi:alkane 1-monooxygenase
LVLFSDKLNIDLPWFKLAPKTNTEYFIFSLVHGYFAAVNTINGHELVHKKEWFNKYIGIWSYTKFMYTHFLDDHIKGHHKHVGTPLDAVTARKGENVYSFIWRSMIGQHTAVWDRECKRIRRQHGEDCSFATIITYNKMTLYFIIHASLMMAIYVLLGWQSFKYQLLYIFWGVFYLELVDYIEHYGLERSLDKEGIYEPINKLHSWNSNSSPILFRLQRHSDHHAHAFRPY